MRVLALDISTCTGWALLEGEPGQLPKILKTGIIQVDKVEGAYPWNFVARCFDATSQMLTLTKELAPDLVVIEEVNMGKARFSQKVLDWLHCLYLFPLWKEGSVLPVKYVNTSDWRRKLGATLTKEDKKLNAKVRALKKAGNKEGLRALGVRGKIGKKHVAIRYVNQTFGLQLRAKDDDIADAICEGCAWFLGVQICDGK